MRRTKYKGVVPPAVRPLRTKEVSLETLKSKIRKCKTSLEDESLKPAYAKKHFKEKTPCKTLTQLKLFGNPYDMKY